MEYLLFILFILTSSVTDATGEPCTDNSPVPYIIDRQTTNILIMGKKPVCDRYLIEKWYTAEGYDLVTKVPEFNQCGTSFPIYLHGSLPPKDGKEHNLTACVKSFVGICSYKLPIRIKNCGKFYVYYLRGTLACPMAYCFDPRKPRLVSTCASDEFRCNNGICIAKSWRCDKDNDCDDNSDEENCGAKEPAEPSVSTCASDEFRCNNGLCIAKSWRCDKNKDCGDNSDEENCDTTKATTTARAVETTKTSRTTNSPGTGKTSVIGTTNRPGSKKDSNTASGKAKTSGGPFTGTTNRPGSVKGSNTASGVTGTIGGSFTVPSQFTSSLKSTDEKDTKATTTLLWQAIALISVGILLGTGLTCFIVNRIQGRLSKKHDASFSMAMSNLSQRERDEYESQVVRRDGEHVYQETRSTPTDTDHTYMSIKEVNHDEMNYDEIFNPCRKGHECADTLPPSYSTEMGKRNSGHYDVLEEDTHVTQKGYYSCNPDTYRCTYDDGYSSKPHR